MNLNYNFNRAPLKTNAFEKLPIGAIKPEGWLLDQLKLQANGLTGILEEVWEDVGSSSGWLGGSGENWERGPYYCDGLVPLAYILKDEKLIKKATKWIEWSFNSQEESGFYGPKNNLDWWPRMVMNKVIIQYFEASGDSRVLDFLLKYYKFMLINIEDSPLHTWGRARAGDEIISLYWLYNRTEEEFLLQLAEKLYKQSMKWENFLTNLPYKFSMKGYFDFSYFLKLGWKTLDKNNEISKEETEHLRDTFFFSHVVNVAMGIKAPLVYYQQSGSEELKAAHKIGIKELMKYHGTANGIFTGDEHLSGNSPTQGTELCAVAEYMYSLESMIRINGEAELGDILEKLAYNALPATISKDFLSHQYDQQVNQISCTIAKRNWFNNNDDSNIFGLEPNFGCCTANLHQAWPKLAQSLWMATEDKGLAAVVYAPCSVEALVGKGTKAELQVGTEYPFKDRISIKISLEKAEIFPIKLRIPNWSKCTRLWVNGSEQYGIKSGEYFEIRKLWNSKDEIVIHFNMDLEFTKWQREAITAQRGPLVYSLKIGEQWNKLKDNKGLCSDWEVLPTTSWNYALSSDKAKYSLALKEVSSIPFSFEAPPIIIKTKGYVVEEWVEKNNSAGIIPYVDKSELRKTEDIELIPYGCSTLRITQFPKAD